MEIAVSEIDRPDHFKYLLRDRVSRKLYSVRRIGKDRAGEFEGRARVSSKQVLALEIMRRAYQVHARLGRYAN